MPVVRIRPGWHHAGFYLRPRGRPGLQGLGYWQGWLLSVGCLSRAGAQVAVRHPSCSTQDGSVFPIPRAARLLARRGFRNGNSSTKDPWDLVKFPVPHG